MAIQQAYIGEIELFFDYIQTENSEPIREQIQPERISYVLIERLYENIQILPVIYICLNLPSDVYNRVISTYETSEFYLKMVKKNALSNSSLNELVVADTFSYVTSSTNPNYSEQITTSYSSNIDNYMNITIGLVSISMTNKLRKTFNGIYNNITQKTLVSMALEGMDNVIMEELKYDKSYTSYLIPPLNTRYKLLSYIFQKDPFYDSMFTFFMDFDKSYLISKNAKPVPGDDGNPETVIVDIKDYSAEEAYTDGFSIENNSYIVYINAANTNLIINNSVEKISNNLIAYGDDNDIQNLTFGMNNSVKSDTTDKTSFIRSNNAAALKNELQTNAVMIELLKQNLNSDIFTPNKVYNVINNGAYNKYNGDYILSYKRDVYMISSRNHFNVSSTIGLKRTSNEEEANAQQDTVKKVRLTPTSSTAIKTKTSSSSTKYKKNTVTKATRTKGTTK